MHAINLKRTAFCVILLLVLITAILPLIGTARAKEEVIALQPLIDKTPRGKVLHLGSGTYSGPVTIDKPLTLKMENGKIVNESEQPALTLKSGGITLDGLTVVHSYQNAAVPAVLVGSSGNKLHSLTVETLGSGIHLRAAHNNVLTDNIIVGEKMRNRDPATVLRGNGIDLFESDDNTIRGNTIDLMQDGIYVESGKSLIVQENKVSRSRYGFHFMFTEDLLLSSNNGLMNVTGAMVMSVSNAKIRNNHFRKQNSNVHSQGLLLYDVNQSIIERNEVQGNRVGLFIQQSRDNQLTHNQVTSNFIGLQMLDSNDNRLSANTFLSNVVPAQSVNSPDNNVDGNYWDDAQVLDLIGSGFSDLPYEINPFFLKVTGTVPAFQLLFHSPGLPFLEELFHTGTEDWLKDMSPLLKPVEAPARDGITANYKIAALSVLLLAISLYSIYRYGGSKP
ncbi:nitrous oxidase accessory protein [Paenibacillus uliginis N3/975]|uniref:Nitrous oxidase accessory protein n=1 Tax=Paenibacillus uliginis N3/975 TaxID=1313296 RepID=A0A1X7G9B3_9BACL|nr:NosD domain-containing protein [Paenibacillus uliginis]SMF66074.1 nitrous oxidase accessory protein [Paenibacillus uliginis N3/975]